MRALRRTGYKEESSSVDAHVSPSMQTVCLNDLDKLDWPEKVKEDAD